MYVYIYVLHTPRTWDLGLPFWIRKGSRAAGGEQRGSRREPAVTPLQYIDKDLNFMSPPSPFMKLLSYTLLAIYASDS